MRQCEDTFFANRSRPCLQYQIGRCRGPCVGLVSPEDYAQDVADTIARPRRPQHEVIADLGRRMEAASQAPRVRGRGAPARPDLDAQADPGEQTVTRARAEDIDAVAIAGQGGEYCVSVVFVRGGRNLGSSNYFPKGGLGGEEEALAAFLAQYYLARGAPAEILVDLPLEDCDVLESALSRTERPSVRIRRNVRGTRARWLAMARTNAELGLSMRASSRATVGEQLDALTRELQLGRPPARIECFDVSHTMGELAVASCVVFGVEGPIKSDYRRFNIASSRPATITADFARRSSVASHASCAARRPCPTCC